MEKLDSIEADTNLWPPKSLKIREDRQSTSMRMNVNPRPGPYGGNGMIYGRGRASQ